jgi:hypothetical protein
MKTAKLILAITIMCVSYLGKAQSIEDLQPLIQLTLTTDNQPSDTTYESFWKIVNSLGSRTEIDKSLIMLEGLFLTGLEFQKENWLSVKISYESGVVVKTQRLIELESTVFEEINSRALAAMNEQEYRSFISAFDEESARENARRLLVGAANKTQIETTDGQVLVLDEPIINQVIENIEPGFERIKILLQRPQ